MQTVDDDIRSEIPCALLKLFAKPQMRSVRLVDEQNHASCTADFRNGFDVAHDTFVGG